MEVEVKLQALQQLMDDDAVSAQGFVSQDQIQDVIGVLQQNIATYAEYAILASDPKNLFNVVDFKATLHALQYILNLHTSIESTRFARAPTIMTLVELQAEMDDVRSEKHRLSREMNKY